MVLLLKVLNQQHHHNKDEPIGLQGLQVRVPTDIQKHNYMIFQGFSMIKNVISITI